MKCSNCDGKGFNSWSEGEERFSKDCVVCNGKGKVEEDEQ